MTKLNSCTYETIETHQNIITNPYRENKTHLAAASNFNYRIDIDIDFNKRNDELDPSKAIDRLEQIEKETRERFETGAIDPATGWPVPGPSRVTALNFNTIMQDFEQWKANITAPEPGDVDSLFNDLSTIERNMGRFSDNSESRME